MRREELDREKDLGNIRVEGMVNHETESLWERGHERFFSKIKEDIVKIQKQQKDTIAQATQ